MIMFSPTTIDSGFDSGSSPEVLQHQHEEPPMSRTAQYRKVMKPLLERKRRARINRCLDDLKDIMVAALQSEGESITKLEKADVLELTVRHLRKLKQQNALGLTPQATYAGRFKAGYAHCAQEVSKFVTHLQSSSSNKTIAHHHQQQQKLKSEFESGAERKMVLDVNVSTRLLSHLGGCIQALESMPPSVLSMVVPQQNIQSPQTNNYPSTTCTTTTTPNIAGHNHLKRPLDFNFNNDYGVVPCSTHTPPPKAIKLEPTASQRLPNKSSCGGEAWRPW